MIKNLRWKIPLIVVVIAIGIMILYPPAEKVLKRESVKEIDGKVVERTTLEKSWTNFFITNPVIRETIVSEETDTDGKQIRNKTVEYTSKGKIKLGLDLKGGSELLYKVRVDEREDHPGITKEIIEVLKKRLDLQGVIEYRIQEQGSHRILIQVPGATKTEIEALKNRITRLGKLEFRLAASTDSPEYKDALEGKQAPGFYKHWLRKKKGEEGEAGKWHLIRNKTEISGEHLFGIYYMGVGWVANGANALNIFLIVGAMALLNATTTLPGIAGLVLMIGMGIDANVLIFERIREEKAKGKPIRATIKAGYEKAFSAIFDSNITTLITGVILAAVGTGPVKGFAWTLILGLSINLFTSIFVTRVIYELFMDLSWIKNFSMFRLIGIPNIKFINYRFILVAISGACIIGGITTFVLRGNKKYDIDFTGGTLVHLHLKDQTPPGFVRTALAETGYEEAEVQSIWSEENLTQFATTADEFGIRIKELNEEKVKQKLTEDIKGVLDKTGLFAGIDFVKPYVFNLRLQNPADEITIQKSLKDA